MPGHGLQARGIAREQKMIYAGMTLFLEQGYERTTTAQIARKAGMSPASFFAAFENKEALLLRLTQIMFRSQFSRAEKMLPADQSPLLLYAMETAAARPVCHGVFAAVDVRFHQPEHDAPAAPDLLPLDEARGRQRAV